MSASSEKHHGLPELPPQPFSFATQDAGNPVAHDSPCNDLDIAENTRSASEDLEREEPQRKRKKKAASVPEKPKVTDFLAYVRVEAEIGRAHV